MSENIIYTEDYPVECGFKEIAATSKVSAIKWRYRLWASGIAECWGTLYVTSSISETTSGSDEYRSDLFVVKLPFTVDKSFEPILTGTATQSCSVTNSSYDGNSIVFRLSRAGGIPKNVALNTRLHVLAEWSEVTQSDI